LTAPMNFQSDFAFASKGKTLAQLSRLLRLGKITPFEIIPVSKWEIERDAEIRKVISRFSSVRLAVRSSSTDEDTIHNSNAGAFLSMIDVKSTTEEFAPAVDAVIASYGDNYANQEVLIQPMVQGVVLSGVILTRDLDTGSPYYVINYDDYSGRTDTVTSGAVGKMVMVHRANPNALHSPRMRKLVEAVQEIEAVTNSHELDIEFCMTSNQTVHILQVRPLAARSSWNLVSDQVIDEKLAETRQAIEDLQNPLTGIVGSSTILGEMPDWNPAEMIGNTPRGLALSLYKFLITDKTWSQARAKMGYKNIEKPLLTDFVGRPYIDVRNSLNSFIPEGLDNGIAERLVNFQLLRLAENREMHDKLEFEIAITCLDFAYAERTQVLRDSGFSVTDLGTFHDALQDLTWKAVSPGSEGLLQQLAITDRVLIKHTTSPQGHPIERVRDILEECIQYGTLPFSILARHAFIGVSFLKSLVVRDVLSDDDINNFMRSIHTVAADIVGDLKAVTAGVLQEEIFLARHGHLRPGTYDILSWRYDEKPDLYLNVEPRHQAPEGPTNPHDFSIPSHKEAAVASLLKELNFDIGPQHLWEYIGTAIAAREKAKYAFSRGISDALVEIGNWGEAVGLSRDDLSHIKIMSFLENHEDINKLSEVAIAGREAHQLTRAVRLPYLITEPDDIDVVYPARGQATFITNKTVTAPILHLHTNEAANLDGQIVLIESADPGFDWIFTHDISGLVTQFGGANSHMAIRCAEFGLPAAIGCAERTFSELLKSSVIELNCAARKVTGH